MLLDRGNVLCVQAAPLIIGAAVVWCLACMIARQHIAQIFIEEYIAASVLDDKTLS